MRVFNVQQNSPEWLMLRLGIPTASEFDRIITPKTGKLSSQSDGYMCRLLAEFILGYPLEQEGTEWMIRGQEMEDAAIEAAEFMLEVETDRVGFITTDDGMIGCSPDRTWKNGKRGCEMKCPSPAIHVGYMRGNRNAIDDKYRCQLAGQIWIAEFEGVDVFSYHPDFPTVHIAVEHDDKMEEFIGNLSGAVRQFSDLLEAAKVELTQKYGPFVRRAPPAEPDKQFDMTEADVDMIWDHLQARKGA